MVFKEISKSKLKEGDFLWRYIDLHKLIDFAINQELHFTRNDQFSDPFEGVTYKLIKQRYFAKKSKITNPNIDQSIRDEHNRRVELTLKNYEEESVLKQKTQFINCWIRSQRESIAMWNLYSNQNSVAIKIKARDIIDYFKMNLELQPLLYPNYEFICGSVTYLKLNPLDPFENKTLPTYSSFKKEFAYDFEKEFRFLIATPTSEAETNPKYLRYKITKNFIELIEIICHPEMENWKFENMKDLCSRLDLLEPIMSKTEMRI